MDVVDNCLTGQQFNSLLDGCVNQPFLHGFLNLA